MIFTRRIDTTLSYDDAITAATTALHDQGFGTLTEIDVRQTLKTELDVDTPPQLIVGARNRSLAHRATQIDPRVAALLPCKVAVRVDENHSVVEALDPAVMADVAGTPGLQDVADEAARRIHAALDTLPRR